jgi:hypothetical protein
MIIPRPSSQQIIEHSERLIWVYFITRKEKKIIKNHIKSNYGWKLGSITIDKFTSNRSNTGAIISAEKRSTTNKF